MKLKIVFAVVMASTALVVLLSAGTASATVFCEEDKAPCPEAKRWKEKTTLDFIPIEIFTFWLREDPEVVTDDVAFDGCQSTLLTTITNPGSATSTVLTENNKFTWSSCTNSNHDTLAAGELEFHAIGTSNATVTVKNLKIKLTSKLVECVFVSSPSAHFGELISSGTGDAVLRVDTVLTWEKFGSCWLPEVRLTGEYTLENPSGTPLFVKAS